MSVCACVSSVTGLLFWTEIMSCFLFSDSRTVEKLLLVLWDLDIGKRKKMFQVTRVDHFLLSDYIYLYMHMLFTCT